MKTITAAIWLVLFGSAWLGCSYSPRNNAHLTHAWDEFTWAGMDVQPNTTFMLQVNDHGNWGPPVDVAFTPSTATTTDAAGVDWFGWNTSLSLGVASTSGVPLDGLWVPAGSHQKSITLRTVSRSSGSVLPVFDDGAATDTCMQNNQSGGGAQIISNCASSSGGTVTLFAPCGTKGEACCPDCDPGLSCAAQEGISKCLLPPGGACGADDECGGNSMSCIYGACTGRSTLSVGGFSTTIDGVSTTLITSFPGVGTPGNAAKFVPNQIPGTDVTFYSWPNGNGQSGGTGDQQGSNWACLPYNFTRMSGIAGSTVTKTLARDKAGNTLGFAVRYVHGTCSFRADWKQLFFDTFSKTVQDTIAGEVQANEPGFGYVSMVRDYDFAQPQFTGSGTSPTWGFFYTAKFTATYSLSVVRSVATSDLYLSPGYSFTPSSDGHVTVTPLTQGVVIIPGDNTLKTQVQDALKIDASRQMQSLIAGQLDQPLSRIASNLGMTLSTKCDPGQALSDQQQSCFSQASDALKTLDPNGAITQTNFSCLRSKECAFHPIVQAVNVLPDALELVFSPSVSDTGPDHLSALYQTVDAAQRKSDPNGFHMCSDPDPVGISTGSAELMWNGADGVFNTECGALLQ